MHITDIWNPIGKPMRRCCQAAFCQPVRSLRLVRSTSNFFTPTTVQSAADKNWLTTVAHAAPATPICKGTMNTTSSTTLSKAENTKNTSGVRLSPKARSMLEIML